MKQTENCFRQSSLNLSQNPGRSEPMTTPLYRFPYQLRPAVGFCLCLPSVCVADEALSLPVSRSGLLLYALLVSLLAIVLALYLYKYCQAQKRLGQKYQALNRTHEELLARKHHWLAQEAHFYQHIDTLEKRLTARTETVNKINHELTKTLEQRQQYQYLFNAQGRAVNNSELLLLIVDKHYRICFASQAFLTFTGLHLTEIQDKPLRLLEKHICLPEMMSNGLSLNQDGLLNTQLKCRDAQDDMHVFNARISLSWSAQKEIIHYVILIDKE